MHGFPRLTCSRGLVWAALLALALLPATASAQSKAQPPKQSPSTSPQGRGAGVPLSQETAHVRLGDEAPNFKLLDRSGQSTSFHEWRGHRGAVLLFADRTQEFPDGFSKLVRNLEKLDVCTVAICRSSGAIPASIPSESDGAVIFRDRWGDLAGQFGVVDQLTGDAVPAAVILDPLGKVRYISAGAIPDLAIVEGIVNGVLERAKQETY